jgi:Domain of unknown function DUF29
MAKLDAATELVGYDEDYHAWALEQIELLKAGRFSDLDIEHLADELKSLLTSEQHEIENRLTVLLQHLLKWELQPAHRSNSWRATILEQRLRINRVIQRSPSLRRYPAAVMDQEYVLARLRAADETDIPLNQFPKSCPYSAAQALDDGFWPGGGADFED